MTSTFTPNLNLELMGTGDQSGTWGAELNNAVFTILDNAMGSYLNLPLTNLNVTLTTTQSQNHIIYLNGSLTGNVTVTIPNIGRSYLIWNNTTGAFTVTIRNAGGGATVAPRQGYIIHALVMFGGIYFLNDALGYRPVYASAWSSSITYIGWNAGILACQVDSTYFGNTWPLNITGNSNTASSVGGVSNPTAKGTLIAYQSGIAEFGGVLTDGTAQIVDLPSPWVQCGIRAGPAYTGGVATLYPRCRALMTQ